MFEVLGRGAQIFAINFSGLVLESIPFLLLGAIISAALDLYLPNHWFAKYTPQNSILSGILGILLGMLMPICECSSVIIVRRMLAKGATPAMAFSYMLTATVVNPITLASTWAAFPSEPNMVFWRAGSAILLSSATVWFLLRHVPMDSVNATSKGLMIQPKCSAHISFPATVLHEFQPIFALFSLGAGITAVLRYLLPPEFWFFLQDHPLLAVPAMMILAVVLSICSQADAFIASSFTGISFAAKLAFLAIGPLVDIKLILVYRKYFTARVVRILVFVPLLLTFFSAMLLEAFL